MLPVALAALLFSAAPSHLASAPFAQLPTHGAAAKIQWTWPEQQLFLQTLRAPIAPPRMALGSLRRLEEEGAGTALLKQIAAGGDAIALATQAVTARDAQPGALIWTRTDAIFEWADRTRWLGGAPAGVYTSDAATVLVWADQIAVVDAAPEPLPAKSHATAPIDWTYSTTLLVAEDPVYAADPDAQPGRDLPQAKWDALSKAMQTDPKAALALLDALDLKALSGRDHRLGQVARFLHAQGRTDAALDAFARFRPMGRCSMDRAPAHAARSYAEACYAAGRIGCFLQLQVRIMGDHFDRVAWSSYGEAAANTQSKALVEAGVDAKRFLRGLLLRFDADTPRPRAEMNLWRLARSMHESGIDFAPDLEALATDPRLDQVNRHRAAQTLWFLWRRAQQVNGGMVKVRFARLDLLPVSAGWVDAVERAQAEADRR